MSKAGRWLLLCVICLFMFGLLMVFNTTAAEAIDKSLPEQTHTAFYRQIFYGALATCVGGCVYRLGYQRFIRHAPLFLGGSILLLILALVPGVGRQLNGAYRWIEVAGVSLQPSEFAKVAIPLFYIHVWEKASGVMALRDLIKFLLCVAVTVGLILAEPDNGTVAIIMTIVMALLFLSRVRWIYWALPVMVMGSMGLVFALNMPHVRSRLSVYMHPELDLQGKGHQPYQAKIAAGSGVVWGKGPGESLQKQGYLPEARSDYIAAIFAEEFGFIGVLGLLTLLMAITAFGFRIAYRAKDQQGFFIATIMVFLLSFQAFLNLGVVSGLLPSKGTNLPFFSQGGSSLIAVAIALSLILSVGKICQIEKKSCF